MHAIVACADTVMSYPNTRLLLLWAAATACSIVVPQVSGARDCALPNYPCQVQDKCILLTDLCDGKEDCSDGSDETNHLCADKRCPESSFKCDYGACIPLAGKCNGSMECADGSDELSGACPGKEQETRSTEITLLKICSSNEYLCGSGDQCVETNTTCNGKLDCEDGSDETEEICKERVCKETEIRCGYGGCAEGGAFCDLHDDCFDGSDETRSACTGKHNKCSNQGPEELPMFQCRSGECIQVYKQCDGNKDCADGSDEGIKCERFRSCVPVQQTIHIGCASTQCQDGELRSGSVVEVSKNQCMEGIRRRVCYNGFWLTIDDNGHIVPAQEDVNIFENSSSRKKRSNDGSSYEMIVHMRWPLGAGTARLLCPAQVEPEGMITWIRGESYFIMPWTPAPSDKYEAEDDGRILVIRNITKGDSTTYTCQTQTGRVDIVLVIDDGAEPGTYSDGLEKGAVIAIAVMIAVLILCVGYLIQYAIPASRQWKKHSEERKPLTDIQKI